MSPSLSQYMQRAGRCSRLVECFHEECAKPHFHHGKYKDTQAGFQQVCETYCNRDIKYMKNYIRKSFFIQETRIVNAV